MTDYETLEEHVKDFGNRSYLQVARKRVVDGDFTTKFVVITRGFYDAKGARRWTKFVTLPDDDELRSFIVESLQTLEPADGSGSPPDPAEAAA